MQQPGTCWVGFPVPRLYRDPVKVLVASTLDGVMGVISEVEEYSAQGYHMVGMLSYEAAPAFDPSLRVSTQPCAPGLPLAWFAVYKDGEDCPTPPSSGGGSAGSGGSLPGAGVGAWAPSMQRSRYDEAIATLRGCIKSGDAYQVNLTLRLRAGWERRVEEDGVFLAALLRAQRCSYGAYLNMGDFRVLSASPELFFSWDRGTGALSALPMKGTRPRGLHAREDAALHTDLKNSEKDAAENLMIVDLLRNDMGRLAKPGSVAVTDLFKITAYPTVWQMTTRVSSVTREGCTLRQVLTALFPCGSITGAPKVSAMGIIESLEGEGRGVYCGAIVHIAPRGGDGGGGSGGGGGGGNGGGGAPLVTASVPIRTLLVDTQGGKAIYGVGGGVTWDSKAEGEWDEAHAKAAVLRAACGQGDNTGGGGGGGTSASITSTSGTKTSASVSPISIPPSPLSVEPWFSLFETLRLEGGEGGGGKYTLLARHLQRMQGSAIFLGFPWDTSKAEAALESCRCNTTSTTTITTGQTYRVRLTLSLKGDFTVTKEPLVGGPCNPCFLPLPPTLDPLQQHQQHPLKLALLAPFPVPHRHPLLFHKTTDRGVYDVPKEAALKVWREGGERERKEKEEVFDVLLFNERGEVTEFTIGSIVCCLKREGEGEGEGGLSHHHYHHYVTPPISSGCLPGVFREELVSEGSVKEATLTINDVRTALAVWLVNSVRGWVPIRLL